MQIGSITALGIKEFDVFNTSFSENISKTNALLSAYQIREIRKVINPASNSHPNAYLYASKIYYGWSLNYLLSGDSKTFTNEIGLELRSLIQSSGVNFSNRLQELNISHDLTARGLEQKQGSIGISINPSEINENFIEGNSMPIFVELTFLKDYDPLAINWKALLNTETEIPIEFIAFSLSKIKDDGRGWDNTTPPDPYLLIKYEGEEVFRTSPIEDTLTPEFTLDVTINYMDFDKLEFLVYDHDDWTEDDFIGYSIIDKNQVNENTTTNQLYLTSYIQIQNGVISFKPLDH
ncbi:MAG: C2 domain-containing protein [Balneola sp.]